MAKIQMEVDRVIEAMYESLAAQKERFLLGHLDKLETHYCAQYPQQSRYRAGGESSYNEVRTQLIALIPRTQINDLHPPEEVMERLPYTILSFTLETKVDDPAILNDDGIPYWLEKWNISEGSY